jgi:hypothetical protein
MPMTDRGGRPADKRSAPEGLRVISVLAVLGALGCAACAALGPKYVRVDSVAASGAEAMKDYYLLSEFRQRNGDSRMGGGSSYEKARDAKFLALTREVLQSAGFNAVDSPDEAQLVVLLQYGIDIAFTPGQLRKERTSMVEIVAFDWAAVRDLDHRNAIWHTSAYMEGSSGGLGRVVPILIEAAGPYLGTNTDGAVEIARR